ncbi:peptide methionine sulfoxide reductase-like [Amphiura filiformis]|uniref:peptide methionine sulfoxide reductase-like n=1 Tax=Amphiura filiformis TaxID=82378 RepID=UPI003B211264
MFWANHDPTQCHKRQYMSAIFYHSEEQKSLAEKSKDEHQETIKRTIQTKILPAGTFYQAEDYHQKYMLRKHHDLLKSLNLSSKQIITSHMAARLNGYIAGMGMLKNFEAELNNLGLNEEQTQYVRDRIRRGGMN